MAAFDKIKSGIPSMDQLLDYIRLGDNVVWQVNSLEEFRFFAEPLAQQAISDGRNLIYMRFAGHEPLLTPRKGLKICEFDPDEGFEAFTVKIYQRITEEGKEAFYVFDSLSSLQSVWYTDLMMGNFFRVTCPYLFQLDTVAYFPLLRGRHSFDTVARIRDPTQLLLDVHTGKQLYLHPVKVWNRYSTRMFLPHSCDLGTRQFRTVEDGVAISRYYQLLDQEESGKPDQNYDSYDRFFSTARMAFGQGEFSRETEDQILESTMTRDHRLQEMIRKYFQPGDYFRLRDRIIGSGSIGGKACGMLLARKIAYSELPSYREHSEPHDSFYIGSDVFYTYIVSNNCWGIRIAQRSPEGYFSRAEELRTALLSGEFPANIREKFRSMLEYFGQSPIIVRSSSFLEDGFGNAFAGKYESVFCVNQGTPDKRLEDFEQAVRTVYASTMSPAALEYRMQRGLAFCDEQMAVLVQRVSGAYWGSLFFPSAAGVGYSCSAYRWNRDMDPSAGMLRLVAGLGTRAVDRTENDYPRLANLDRPAVSLHTTTAEKHQFSQRFLDVLDTEQNCPRSIEAEELMDLLPLWYKKAVMERDYEAEDACRRMNRFRQVWFVTCQKLLENIRFTSLMQDLLKTLELAYQNPVDIEYTVNLDDSGDFIINLLQCRPLYTGENGGRTRIPHLPSRDIFFELKDSSLGNSMRRPIEAVVQISPVEYYQYPYSLKPAAAQALGRINRYYRSRGKRILLASPGRLGTSSPELGVPVTFAEISGFSVLCEISDNRAGYLPELSYGSHMFQDLVESDILYCALWNDRRTLRYSEDFFLDLENLFPKICPDFPELTEMFRVTEPEHLYLWNDIVSGKTLCGYMRKASD